MSDLLHYASEKSKKFPEPGHNGRWATIRWTPDLTTGEILNIGVILIDQRDRLHLKVLSEFGRLNCLYGPKFEKKAKFALRMASSSIRKQGLDADHGPHISFGNIMPAAGDSVEEIIERVYKTTVTLARIDDSQKRVTKAALNNEKLHKEVYAQLRTQYLFDADSIIQLDPYLDVPPQFSGQNRTPLGRERRLYVPLRDTNHLGSIVSTDYGTIETAERHLLKSVIDLETAREIRKENNVALFIKTPDFPEHLNHRQHNLKRQLDDLYDQTEFHMRTRDIIVSTQPTTELMTSDIAEWFGLEMSA